MLRRQIIASLILCLALTVSGFAWERGNSFVPLRSILTGERLDPSNNKFFSSFGAERNTQTGYTDPYVPIYCEGDDLSRANPKPKIIYKEVPGTKVEIPNMPAIKTQTELGECRAFAVAALMQWYSCTKWKDDIPDCKNPPADSAISYFGMMMYTHRDEKIERTFQPNQDKGRSMYDILNNIKQDGAAFILESCKPYEVMVTNFKAGTVEGKKNAEAFFGYLRKMYELNKVKPEVEIKDCPACVTEINKKAGVNTSTESLRKALRLDSYDKFLYSLFFDGCDRERLPSAYQTKAYPDDSLNITQAQLKAKIIEVLKQGKPVLYPKLCLDLKKDGSCGLGHAVVISGYKQVHERGSPEKKKDVLKIHNSQGIEWQRMNNDGWLDADIITNAVYKDYDLNNRIESGSILWLGP